MQHSAILGMIAAAGWLVACSPDDHAGSRVPDTDVAFSLAGSGSAIVVADAGTGSGSGSGSGSDAGTGSGSAAVPDAGSGSGSGTPPDAGSGSGSGSGMPPDAGSGSGSGSGGPGTCTFGRRVRDWRPAPGELDNRDWTDIVLTPSPSNHDVYPWTVTVPGQIAEVKLSPPGYYGTPAYAFGIDYDGTIDECPFDSTLHAWFLPGIYNAEISYRDGRPPALYTVFAGSSPNGPVTTPTVPGAAASSTGGTTREKTKDPNCPEYPDWDQIPWNMLPYDPGAFIIEDPEADNKYIERGVKAMGDRAVRAGDVVTGAQKIVDAYNAKGSPLNVVMVGHGSNTNLSVGAGTGFTDAKSLFMTGTKSNKDFIAKVSAEGKQRVQRLAMIGCCVAGRVQELANDHLMCDMARGLAPGAAITEVLAFGAVTNSVEPSGRREGYFTVSGKPWSNTGKLVKKGHCDFWQSQKPPPK